ncbi:MAG: hypothetical protein FIA94_04140 [Nitrospirae bacterium]|nr:hypothetical protein [Nitrospirota bacterium]
MKNEDNRRLNNSSASHGLKNPGDSRSPDRSVPNPVTSSGRENQNAISQRENLTEGMRNGEDRQTGT